MHARRAPQAGNAPASLRSGMFQRCMWRCSAGALHHIRGLIEFAGIVASVAGENCRRIVVVRFCFEKTIYFLSYMANLRLRCDVIALEFTVLIDTTSQRLPLTTLSEETTMTNATNILKAAIRVDGSTRKGCLAIRLMRGRYSKIFLPMSRDLYDSAMRTFDRHIGRLKPESQRTSWEAEACK